MLLYVQSKFGEAAQLYKKAGQEQKVSLRTLPYFTNMSFSTLCEPVASLNTSHFVYNYNVQCTGSGDVYRSATV